MNLDIKFSKLLCFHVALPSLAHYKELGIVTKRHFQTLPHLRCSNKVYCHFDQREKSFAREADTIPAL